MWSELTKAIAHFDIPADWIGIRAVKQTNSTRSVRDGLPLMANPPQWEQGSIN